MTRVAILVNQQPAMFELGCALELFALPRQEYSHWYQAEVVTFHPSPLAGLGKISLQVTQTDCLQAYDMLVVPAWSIIPSELPHMLKEELQALVHRGGRIISFCSGAFLLAEVGVLGHRPACTHWRYQAQFRERFPDIELLNQVLYCFDGRIGCSAGSAAGLDLGLEVIRQDYGQQVANQVARRLVISPHRSGGQSQYVETPMPELHSHFSATLDWVCARLNQPIDIDDMASQAKMSRRNFDRRFRLATNMSPKEWLNRRRVERARALLEQPDWRSLEWIADQCGFASALNLRLNFQKYMTVSPSEYRERFAERAR
ncbi:GlxA family transcriptional regulator [Gynuella sp.]|uniref:GlxA family transcriptional regulator n=1 Tax=Gynuella sp. TaxID=2969146 RepID=UPI003D1237D1